MPSNCPICDQPIPVTAAHCSVCGFPTALAIEGLRSMPLDDPATSGPSDGGTVVLRTKLSPVTPSPEAELCAAISRDLRTKLDLVRQLGRGVPDVTSEMCQAALVEAEGRVSEALEILRGAQSRLEDQTVDLLKRRLDAVATRLEVLQKTGVQFALRDDLARLTDLVESGEREEAAARIVDTERRVSQFESDWKGLQGLLAQIESLRGEANELKIPLGEISSELETIKDRLGEPGLTEEALDEVAQQAAQTLMLLHEAIPTSLEEELGRHETALNRFPDDHEPSAVARRLHVEATRHLKKGRLSEAIASVRDLRRQIEILQNEVERAPEPVAPRAVATTGQTETEAETLDRLLKKARSLAARVRTLPSDTDTARDAAIQIREATDLLRSRQLKEADVVLTRLMRMLAYETPRS